MKVLIVGLGSIAKKHIEALRVVDPLVEIFALRSSSNLNSIECVTDLLSLKSCPSDINFAIISSPTFKHIESINQVLELNCPLFIEKPVYHKLDSELAELVSKVSDKGLLTYVGCNLRHHEALIKFKELLENELNSGAKVEEVNSYCGSYLPNWRPGIDYKKSYSASIEMGGGVDLDVIHELDYLLWIFGTPLDVRFQKFSRSHIDIPSIDAAYYWLNYAGFQINLSLNYFRKSPKRETEVVLDSGVLKIDLLNSILTKDNRVIFQGSSSAVLESYTTQMKYFIEHIQNQKKFENDLNQGVQTLKICLENAER